MIGFRSPSKVGLSNDGPVPTVPGLDAAVQPGYITGKA